MTGQDWWIHLKENDYSFETFSIYADWLEDNELDNDCQAIRSIIEKQYRPELFNGYYIWWKSLIGIEDWRVIPYRIFENLNSGIKHEYAVYYTNMKEAYQDLIKAIIVKNR